MPSRAAAGVAMLLLAAPAAALEVPFVAARGGARCDLEPSGSLTCRYRVGASLEFTLLRVGEAGVGIEIQRDNREGDYTLDPIRLGSCLFVRFGWAAQPPAGMEFSYATVSMVNGQVYDTLERCRRAR